jgi:hypothetical protein
MPPPSTCKFLILIIRENNTVYSTSTKFFKGYFQGFYVLQTTSGQNVDGHIVKGLLTSSNAIGNFTSSKVFIGSLSNLT